MPRRPGGETERGPPDCNISAAFLMAGAGPESSGRLSQMETERSALPAPPRLASPPPSRVCAHVRAAAML